MEKESKILANQKVAKRVNKTSGLRKKLIVGTLVGAGILGGIAAYQYNTPRVIELNVPGYGPVQQTTVRGENTYKSLRSGDPINSEDGRGYQTVRETFRSILD